MQNYSSKCIKILFPLILLSILGCEPKEKSETINNIQITPTPTKLLYKRGSFELIKSTKILLNLSDEEQKANARDLINSIITKTGHKLKISDLFTTDKIINRIELTRPKNGGFKPEGFKIEITNDRIKIISNDKDGFTYASHVFTNLLTKNEQHKWIAPQLIIEDEPFRNIRAIYVNTSEPVKINESMIQQFVDNRINYLFITENVKIDNRSSSLHVLSNKDTTNLSFSWKESLVQNESVSEFYTSSDVTNKKEIIFEINKISMLNPDSISALGEAMWSNPNALKQARLKNHNKETKKKK